MNQVDPSLPDDFDNTVKLFPLPNLVLFPGVVQALHLFEPRYRQLMSDAVEGDGLISIALMQPPTKRDLLDAADLCRTVCIGKIVTHVRLDDGRFNLLLMGIRRARLIREINQGKLYRMAEVELVTEIFQGSPRDGRQLREAVVRQFRTLTERRPQVDVAALDQLLESEIPLGQLLDLISYSSGAEPREQQAVLDELNIIRRGRLVLDLLQHQQELAHSTPAKRAPDFPPGFSLN